MTDPTPSRTGVDRWAPLSANAWMRYDIVRRMLPAGIHDVLDIGCGQAAIGVRLAQRYTYVGVELDPTSAAVATQRISHLGRGTVHQGTVDVLGDRTFDLACAFEVLEHIDDDAGALTQWSSHLNPGGWLLISVPAFQSRYGPADELVGHFRRYNPESLREVLEKAGFKDIDLRQYGMPLGYALETARNTIAKRRLTQRTAPTTVVDRTAGSGRLLQPKNGWGGVINRWGTAPFRVTQRFFPASGPGLIARARKP